MCNPHVINMITYILYYPYNIILMKEKYLFTPGILKFFFNWSDSVVFYLTMLKSITQSTSFHSFAFLNKGGNFLTQNLFLKLSLNIFTFPKAIDKLAPIVHLSTMAYDFLLQITITDTIA